jgi:hypothetical protein
LSLQRRAVTANVPFFMYDHNETFNLATKSMKNAPAETIGTSLLRLAPASYDSPIITGL